MVKRSRPFKALKENLRQTVRKHMGHAATQRYDVTVEDGEITIRWQPVVPVAVAIAGDSRALKQLDTLATSLLGSVAQRAWVHGAKDDLRDHVSRDAPWTDIHELWNRMSLDIPMSLSTSTPGAFVTLASRLRQMVAVTPAAKLHRRGGRLVCRLGIDGTTRWAKPIEVMAISITGGHGAKDWEPVGIFFTKETRMALDDLLAETSWNAEVRSGITVTLPGATTPTEVYYCITM